MGACRKCGSKHIFSPSFKALRAEVPHDGGRRRVIGRLTAAVIITLVFGSTYAALQQLGRRSAKAAPAAAAAQIQLIGSETVRAPRLELTPDSGVFVIEYGPDDKPVSGAATLHGSRPTLPAGVLQTARTSGSDVVTWQPESGLRIAVVARPAAGKVIVAGQSLTPLEDRDRMVLIFLAAGWLGSIVVLAAGYATTGFLRRRASAPERKPPDAVIR